MKIPEKVLNEHLRWGHGQLTAEEVLKHEQAFNVDLQSHLLQKEGAFHAVFYYDVEIDLEQLIPHGKDSTIKYSVITDTHVIEVVKVFGGVPITSYQAFPLVLNKDSFTKLYLWVHDCEPAVAMKDDLELHFSFSDCNSVDWADSDYTNVVEYIRPTPGECPYLLVTFASNNDED